MMMMVVVMAHHGVQVVHFFLHGLRMPPRVMDITTEGEDVDTAKATTIGIGE